MTSGCCVVVHRDTASLYHTQTQTYTRTEHSSLYRAGVWLLNISIIMSSQSESTSTGDNLLQTPAQVWTTMHYNIWTFLKFTKYLFHFGSLPPSLYGAVAMAKGLMVSNMLKYYHLLL